MKTTDVEQEMRELLKASLIKVKELKAQLAASEEARREPIAIVGIGCRFPGGADSPAAFQELLDAGHDAITSLDERWAIVGARPEGEVPRWAGLLTGSVDGFDAAFFGISPREAVALDPQQRLLLEVCWEALEDAGIPPRSLEGTRTGVFAGAFNADYARLVERRPRREQDAYGFTGNLLSIAAGRLSYTLGLQGPCLNVDTACSSSLVAVHLACHSLRARESDLALAGGVNLILSPELVDSAARTQALSPDGRCKTFDALANGFARGEGAGLVVLKRLSDARRDGDRIWALIRSSAVNQDGRSTGLTAPNVLAQEALLREALENARVGAVDIGFVETHGTGTSLGDPIEVEALRAVLGSPRPDGGRCVLGAVKTNLGHLEAAAGIAGLIKAALALTHERVPRNLHLRTLNPRLRLEGSALALATEPSPWPRGATPRFAGVSSFGMSGTNAHVILEEAPVSEARPPAAARSAELVVLSARSEAALNAQAARLGEHLAAHPALGLGDVAFSLATTRSPLEYRLAIAAASRDALREALAAAAEGQTPASAARGAVSTARGKLAFLFTGQGAQAPGMGRGLHAAWPAFRDAFDRCAALFDRELGRPLCEVMWAEPGSAEAALLDQTGYTQPALFTLEYALAALWRSWGVEPELVAGHSVGEIAAACVAGVFSLEDAARLVAARGRLMQALPPGGAMISIAAPEAEVLGAVAPHAASVSIAAVNGPEQVVIAGAEVPAQAIAAAFAARGAHTRALRVSHAFHSPLMDPMLEAFREVARAIAYREPALPLVSNVSGAPGGEEVAGADYWVEHARRAVRFADGARALHAAGARTFVEVGPKATLLGLLPACLPEGACARVASLGGGREETASMLEALGILWTAGAAVGWSGVFPEGGRRVPLPTYAWQRERYWIDAPRHDAAGARGRAHAGGHPLLGERQTVSTQQGTHLWETSLDPERLPWVVDHRVRGTVVWPGAGYLEMALAAGAEVLGEGAVSVTDVAFVEALMLAEGAAVGVQVVTSEEQPGRLRFQIASRSTGEGGESWTAHARGALRLAEPAEAPAALDVHGLAARLRGRGEAAPSAAVYEAMWERGLEYGPAFQGVVELWQGDGEALGRVRLPEAAGSAEGYRIHPALLDACLQVTAGILRDEEDSTWLPVGLGSLRLYRRPEGELWCHARAVPSGSRESSDRRSVSLLVVDGRGAPVAEIAELTVQRLASSARSSEQDDWFLELGWEPAAVPAPREGARRILLLGDGGGLGAALRGALTAAGHAAVHAVAWPPGEAQGAVPFDDTGEDGVLALLRDAFPGQAPTAVVHLRSLDGGGALDAAAIEGALSRGPDSALCTVKALAGMGYRNAPRLWLVTRGAQAAGQPHIAAEQAPLVGLARVIAMEHPELRCASVDLEPARPEREAEALLAELLADDAEQEVALRGGERRVARILRRTPEASRRARVEPARGSPFRLAIDEPGSLDNLLLRAAARRAPGAGEVEIAVEAAGLNFIDVMKAMGIYPGLGDGPVPLGSECAGRVVAVGEGVRGLAVGQEVMTIAPSGFGTHVTVPARKVAQRPDCLTTAQAASVLTVFMTAWYGLAHLARLGAGERVLIHSATGGTGLAAVQIARHLGAEIFATAGRPEKRAWLRAQGIAHVMASRSLDFRDEVLAATGGAGVDVVLNSLSGKAIEASFEALAGDGRFIELGKTDIHSDRPLGLAPFKKSLQYNAVDLLGLEERRPERFAALLHEVVDLFARGVFTPLPVETFPISRAADAFHKMAQAQHIGKLVLTLHEPEAPIHAAAESGAAIRRDGSYLVTGGLGGLGLSVAGWLADQGAGHLTLVGRSGAATAEQQAAVAALEARGARVTVARADVADRAQMERVMAEVSASGTPLRGVVHAAGLLSDGVLLQQDRARFRQVMAPKILGALHLHELTRDLPLDFFVLYASAAGLLGSPGQGNYAAANTFLDALAHRRRSEGLPALSVDWGAFSEVGLATAQENRGERLTSQGVRSMTPAEGLTALARLLEGGVAQAAVLPIELRQWAELVPAAASSRMLSPLLRGPTAGAQPAAEETRFLDRLAAVEPSARLPLVLELLRGAVSRVLRLPEDRVDPDTPLPGLGLDSLMGLELRHRLKRDTGVDVPTARLLGDVTIAALAPILLGKLREPAGSSPGPQEIGAGVDIEL